MFVKGVFSWRLFNKLKQNSHLELKEFVPFGTDNQKLTFTLIASREMFIIKIVLTYNR